jgi:hypothetical protein
VFPVGIGQARPCLPRKLVQVPGPSCGLRRRHKLGKTAPNALDARLRGRYLLLDWIEDKLAEFNEALPSQFGNWMPRGQSPTRLPATQHPSATNYVTITTTYVTGAMTNIKRVKPKA